YVVKNINAREDLLPNITLGQIILNNCGDPLISLRKTMQFLPSARAEVGNSSRGLAYRKPFEAVGIFGAPLSDVCVAIAPLLAAYEIPLLSVRATSDDLRDRNRFPNFMRMVPPEKISVQALVQLALHFNWTYITVLYADGSYSTNAFNQLKIALRKTEICLAFTKQMSMLDSEEAYLRLAKKLKTDYTNARVIFMFSPIEQQRLLHRAMDTLSMHHMFIFVTLDMFSENPDFNIGGIKALKKKGKCPGFASHLKKANPWMFPDDPWLRMAWEAYHKCSWDVNKSSNESCHQYTTMPRAIVSFDKDDATISDAIHVYALALHHMISDKCPEQFSNKNTEALRNCVKGSELYNYMNNVSFPGCDGYIEFADEGSVAGSYVFKTYKLQENGEYGFSTVGFWDERTDAFSIDTSLLNWDINETQIPVSKCSKPCPLKQYYIHKEVQCCWECKACRSNEIVINASKCDSCPPFTWPDLETATTCITTKPEYPKLTQPHVLALFSSAVLGLFVATTVTIAYTVHRDHPLIRATSKGLCYLILAGSYVTSSTVLLYATKPTKAVCFLQDVGFHIGVHLLFGPLMIRTIRIFRIFSSGKRSVQRPKFVSSSSQIILALSLIMVQSLLIIGAHTTRPTSVGLQQGVPTEPRVDLVCIQPGFLIPFSCNLVVILVCGVFGFLSRNLPENYNESWFIFVSVSTTIFMWVIFLPTSYASIHAHQRTLILGFCLVLNVFITLALLFVPKIYAVV
ncbi:hypothetical protein CAPTEDRAFT_22614, partial [Capitella teleta]